MIDMDNDKASSFADGPNAIWITSQPSVVQQRLRLKTIFVQNLDVSSRHSVFLIQHLGLFRLRKTVFVNYKIDVYKCFFLPTSPSSCILYFIALNSVLSKNDSLAFNFS